MTLSASDWDRLFALLDAGWPGDLTEDGADAYRVLLAGTEPERILAGLQRLLHAGARFRPSAAEILAEARRDPSRPTFDEVLVLLFARRGVLDVRCRKAPTSDFPGHHAELVELVNERLASLHPVVSGFVARVGVQRLRTTNIEGEDGHWRRSELRETWEDFIDSSEHREVAVLAAGTGQRGLARLDPLAALGVGRAPAELGVGEGSE